MRNPFAHCVHMVVGSFLLLFVARAEDRSFVNVGFKLGHTFGDGGGFTAGAEISYTTLGENIGRGILASYDVCNGRTKLHFGAELMFSGLGVSIGPTLVSQHGTKAMGYTGTLFTGLFIYPFYSYTYTSQWQLQELGSYFKFSKQTAGRKFSFG